MVIALPQSFYARLDGLKVHAKWMAMVVECGAAKTYFDLPNDGGRGGDNWPTTIAVGLVTTNALATLVRCKRAN